MIRQIAKPLSLLTLLAQLTACAITQAPAPVEDRGPGSTQPGANAPVPRNEDGVEVYAVPARPGGAYQERSVPLDQPAPAPVENPQAYNATRPDTFNTDNSQQSPAVVALLDSAGAAVGAGNLDGAAASLERALRIEPRNAAIWQRLADVRLRQQQPAQAEAMAVKSNTLAGGDRKLMAGNWRIIAAARNMQGDAGGAQEAEARAAQLSSPY
jgi:tetratricopeptide (TPR) repeat protein